MKNIIDKVEINAPINEVWDLLINPKKTPEYMYTCAIETNFEIDSDMFWRGIHDQVVYVSGKLVEFDPPNKMIYTVIDPNADYDQTPENHLLVTYELEGKETSTILKVTQSGYENVAEGEARYAEAEAGGGWKGVLEKIKEMAEK